MQPQSPTSSDGRGDEIAGIVGAQTERLRRSIEIGMRHVRAEQTNELERIMATIDEAPYFPLLDHDGHGGVELRFLTDFPAVREYYGARHGSYEIVSSRHITAVATEFYTFRESIATLRGVGDVGGVDSDGQIFAVNSAVMFPTGPGGIGGEIVWTRYPFGDIVGGTVEPEVPAEGPVHLPNTRIRNAEQYDRYLDGWRAGDAAAMAESLTDDARWLRRIRRGTGTALVNTEGLAETRTAIAADIATWQPVVIEVLNRVVSEWYVFADLYLELRHSGTGTTEHRRHIALHPVGPDGRLRAEMGDVRVIAPEPSA